MAASNLPWDLDIAVLRRLEKRGYCCIYYCVFLNNIIIIIVVVIVVIVVIVLVPLPAPEAREMMFKKHLSDRIESGVNFNEVVVVVVVVVVVFKFITFVIVVVLII